ncbi:MAG: hypothetical protein ACE5FI_17935, partial [Anaerolineales bacterium]
ELLNRVPLTGAEFFVIFYKKIAGASVPVPFPIPIPCQYNPEELEFEKRSRWRRRYTHQNDVPKAEYSGGAPQEMDLNLFFDTTHLGISVKLYTTPIMMLVSRIPFTESPPLVMFHWGWNMSPISYVERASAKYTFFTPNGVPLRAEMRVRLVEYNLGFLSKLPLNPTTVSEARKTWVVTEGQTLDWIAYQEYGDARQWRHIAKVNGIANPMELRPGQILKLTPLP